MLSPTPTIDRSNLRPGTGYLIAPRVPHGLATVVEGLTREVLRHRPEDIYVFAAHHFEKLLKLREEYHIEEYSNREFSHEFNRDFNLWPTKKTEDIEKPSNSYWSLEKEIEIFERPEKTAVDTEESQEDVSIDRENRKASKQTCSRGPAATKKTSKKSKDNETTSNARATRIISQMTALHGPGKNIQTKDIKQELRKNKLSGEKSKATDSVEKGIRGDRRSRTRATKTDRGPVEEVECTTTTTTTMKKSSNKTSVRRPLKKVRRIETESETETEREVVAKAGLEDGHARSSIKNDDTIRETIIRTGSRERRSEASLSEHSSQRKVSSRALSMDRIRAYVLRKFASTASLEVLRSPTYVEQVQEVIDRAAPIIKEKLEEIGRPRGKRSRSVDLAWNEESLYRHIREEKRHGDEEESGRGKSENGMERKADIMKKEEMEDSLGREETISIMESEEKKLRRRSIGSGKRSRRRESGDFGVVDEVDDNSKHSNKLEHESNATHDTLEARLTATQSILEDISKSTSELGGARRSDPAGNEPSESEVSDHVVSLPVVRPPSSRNSKSATKNGSDCLTLPPISPEAPKSTKKKDELSLPVLLTPVNNGNHSARKSQEQDVSKDAEEASTMYDITSDIEDIAGFPENDHEDAIVDIKQELNSDHQDLLISNVKFINEERRGRNENVDKVFDEKYESLEEFEELEKLEEGRKSEEVFMDSLNVTPEVVDVPLRPDSLEPDEEVKLEDDYVDPAQENAFDRLKDKLIEIEMAERSIEKALACQVATCDIGEMTSQAEKSVTDGKINEAGEPTNEAEETVNEIRKSMDVAKILINNKDDEERKKNNDDEKRKSMNDIEKAKGVAEISNKTEDLNIEDKLTNKPEEIESEIKGSTSRTENSINKLEANGIKKLLNENEAQSLENTIGILKNGAEKVTDQTEITKTAENTTKAQDERSIDKTEKLNEKLSNGVEELAVKIHVKNVQSINARSLGKDSQITEVVETDDDNTSKKKPEDATNEFSQSTTSENVATTSGSSTTNLPNENSQTKARKKRESDKLPMITPLSLELPYSYVLSEGSPCEIPDSVTTVIIPDKPCLSPVTLEDEDYQLESTNQKEESFTYFNTEISKDERQDKDQQGYDMEIFGEYIRPEATVLSIDTDFVRSVKGIKPSQDIVIVHQDLDKIKEEGEEEVKEDERKKTESYQEKENDKEKNVKEEEMAKLATLENIMEHEENEETNIRTIESKDAEEISSGVLEYESLPDTKDLTIDTVLTNEGTADFATESKSLLENSSEESGSTQNTHSTTSDIKESTTSNQSIESPSPDRPVVPELNLDSLQDNTVSSFKITTNETEKEDNDRESDATISLVEPLISDESLMNRLADHEEKIITEGLTERGLQSEFPEADQLYHAEHMEYKWLEKDPLSTEMNSEDETKSQGNNIDLKTTLPEDAIQVDLVLQEEAETEELGSEEEIARELIDLLDKDIQLRAEELDLKKESIDIGESEKSNLEIDDKSNQPLSASMRSILTEQEKKEYEDSSHKIDEIVRTEMTSELSDDITDISQDKDKNNAIIDKESEKIKLEMVKKARIENSHVAPLAQFEQDEILEENGTSEIADENVTVKSKLDNINADHIDIQEKLEDKQTSMEVSDSQSSDSKIEEPKAENIKQEENEQEELQSEKKHEQEKLEAREEYKQEKFDVEEIEQEKLKIQSKDDQENVKIEEKIVNMTASPLEVVESRKDSINESMKNDDGNEDIKSNNKSIIDDQTEKDTENEKEEKSEDLSGKVESVHGPIMSAISEQSTEDHSRFGYWTMGTKSSTVETVIEASDSNTSTEKIVADESEIIADESLIQKKDLAAVVKIQACIRGFVTRRRVRRNASLEFPSNDVSSTRKITSDHLVPQDTSNLREARRLRREEALRNTTLSLENAFATGRLQHTGEFHDSVPLLPFDLLNSKTDSVTSNDSLDEVDIKEANIPDNAKSSANESDTVREHRTTFHKGNTFVDPTFPIVMHLLADASRNCHFTVSQNSHSDFNANARGAKPMEPTMDIVMLGYPRDDENQYLNFITSVEDLNSNMDSLTLHDVIKSTKDTSDAHPSTTSGEGSLREPLALPGVPQGVLIEEVTSLDEVVPSESTKPSTAPKTSLDTNSSMPSEECALEDTKIDLGISPRTTDTTEDRKQEAEGQESDRNPESVGESDLHSDDANKNFNEFSGNNHEHVEEEKDKT
ncbi:PREDICTED: golgin subfamily A member 4-like [Trachymyrmex cornetzi]|uniref:Sperm surface protein Sp17 n=1 Tax=Trachymyrmex cornetzi TaxID=471704 RepID=A0A195E0I0_9HYME|nr:PREDICTED: golgin subfamily A member 4-like [Trachymyrmex cornetzi]XP_018364946.1 PREDICTED: golgin subfamily A member 4-like [Trachymyrmex cornetzi]KYN18457.1 Sperm surface protein Sp17 [Trachymyrmex cornetzi]